MLDSYLMLILAFGTSIAFSAVAAAVPPNAGNLVAAIFLNTMAFFVAGEDDNEAYEEDLEDNDI